ncbi:MAG TPA: PAS domain-containing protein, partial [Rhizomicrobium sp.]|nr:PAS domain-containing protein [Rhizomicrobium sp.]
MTQTGFGVPAGAWRWAALGFVFLAIGAAGLAVGAPDAARWAGVALLAGIGAVASLFLYAVWPREGLSAGEARRVAEAAARANVAWAVTGADGAVLDCNAVYRRMAGIDDDDAPPPPELALGGEATAAVLYRLTRAAAENEAREESLHIGPGLELVAAVRPLGGGQAAWWFTPRIGGAEDAGEQNKGPAFAGPAPAAPTKTQMPPQPASFFANAPVGMALASGDGRIIEANAAFADFVGQTGTLGGRSVADFIAEADRAALNDVIAKAAGGERN